MSLLFFPQRRIIHQKIKESRHGTLQKLSGNELKDMFIFLHKIFFFFKFLWSFCNSVFPLYFLKMPRKKEIMIRGAGAMATKGNQREEEKQNRRGSLSLSKEGAP